MGIAGSQGMIDLGTEIDETDREACRSDVAALFSGMWGEPATVLFSDEEIGESGRIMRKALDSQQDQP